MHLLVAIQEQFPQSIFPNSEERRSREIQRFLDIVSGKQYDTRFAVKNGISKRIDISPEWNKIRPREIKLFDFTIPESIENEVIQDLMAWEGGALGIKIKAAMNNVFIKKMAKKFLGLVPIDRTGLVATKYKWFKYKACPMVYIAIIGKFLDQHNKDGMEMI
ncbi:MAG TPA: hypothetical protein VMX17_00950 [Candidatus Glassbacteria bacterium]|nr:hypothetical protein [Candidatus Glassbacteria bacterium]